MTAVLRHAGSASGDTPGSAYGNQQYAVNGLAKLCDCCGLSESQACHPPGCDAGVTTTGWPAGMLQDDSREFSRWLAGRAGARQCAREAAKSLLPAGSASFAQGAAGPALGAFSGESGDTEAKNG